MKTLIQWTGYVILAVVVIGVVLALLLFFAGLMAFLVPVVGLAILIGLVSFVIAACHEEAKDNKRQ